MPFRQRNVPIRQKNQTKAKINNQHTGTRIMKHLSLLSMTILITYATSGAMQQAEIKTKSQSIEDTYINEKQAEKYYETALTLVEKGQHLKAMLWFKRASELQNVSPKLKLDVAAGLIRALTDSNNPIDLYHIYSTEKQFPIDINKRPNFKIGTQILNKCLSALGLAQLADDKEAGATICFLLGQYYYAGLFGIKKDYTEAVRWLKLAANVIYTTGEPVCDQASLDALKLLGLIYIDGGHGLEKKVDLALHYAKRALELSISIDDKESINQIEALLAEIQSTQRKPMRRMSL
jgi:TPR repeat protein